jgi:hypothetical protein
MHAQGQHCVVAEGLYKRVGEKAGKENISDASR